MDTSTTRADSTQLNTLDRNHRFVPTTINTNHHRTWTILSLNCAKSLATTTFILHYAEKLNDTLLLCLQEPGLESNGSPPLHPSFTLFTPGSRPKCCTYFRSIPSFNAREVFNHDSTFQGISITPPSDPAFTVYNIYSKGGRDTAFAQLITHFKPQTSAIMIGDFNCHHAWWYGGIRSSKNYTKTRQPSVNGNKIVAWLEEQSFLLINKPGIETHYPRGTTAKNPSVIDLCFARGAISEKINSWIVDHDSTSDHSITGARLNLTIPPTKVQAKERYIRAWSKADWNLFSNHLLSKRFDFSNIGGTQETLRAVESLYISIKEGVDEAVPLVKARKKFAPWWSKNLEWLTTKLKRARHRLQRNRSESNETTFQELKKTWESAVRKAKSRHWKAKLEAATNTTIWTTEKKHKHTHSKNLPDIDGASTFTEKCHKFRESLFPTHTQQLPPVHPNFVNSKVDLSDDFTAVSRAEVKRALNSANKKAAVGNDQITFTTLTFVEETVPSALPQIITALLKYGCHHPEWKKAICVVVPKPGKSSYSKANSYRPISLLSSLGKLVEKIAATRISAAGIICGAISPQQFGNRLEHSANHALVKTLTEVSAHLGPQSKRGYDYTTRPSLATHDILGAFNYTSPSALVQIMALRKMPTYLINWVTDFCSDRTLSFSFDNLLEIAKKFENAIPQGSPVSPSLFSIMMSAIIDCPEDTCLPTSIVYADDLSETYADVNIGRVTPALSSSYTTKSQRAAAIGLTFTTVKSEVIHFSGRARRVTKYQESLIITDNSQVREISPSRQIKLLGVILDETLTFSLHAQYAASKAAQALGALYYLRAGDNGISSKIARHLVMSKVLPKMLWGSPVWWTGSQSILTPLEIAYNRAARWITGLPPSTRISKLLRCAHLPPLKVWLDYLTHIFAINTITLPESHALCPLPKFDENQARFPGIHRILSFVSGYLTQRIESRSFENPVDFPFHGNTIGRPSSDKEKEKIRKCHEAWIKSLQPGSLILYTDGSRSSAGHVGAGWQINKHTQAGLTMLKEGSCYLGNQMEVFDAELLAVCEALEEISTDIIPGGVIYVCIDNHSAIQALANNPNRIEGAFRACKAGYELIQKGWRVMTRWVPSHCGIIGNERADRLAKEGSNPDCSKGQHIYISVAWMRRIAREKCLKTWAESIGEESLPWNYPEEWNKWPFRLARAIFRTYSGRTAVDPRHGAEAQMCQCNQAELSTNHILGHCTIFSDIRNRLMKNNAVPPTLTNKMVLDKEWGPTIISFMLQTRLGFGNDLRWPGEREGVNTDDEENGEDFEVGTFE